MRVLAALVLLVGLATFAVAGSQDDTVFPYEYTKVQLDNGFTAYLINAGAPNQLAYVTMVRTGSRDEWEPGKSGFAHFFEHMMFRGTDKYPNFDDITSEMGAARNAFTSSDRTVYYIVANSEYLEKIIDLESDRFQNLNYSEQQFRTEAGSILGEYNNSKYNPFRWLDTNSRVEIFKEHTYRHTTIGFEEDIRAMPEGFEYSRSFYNRYYRPENCVLVLVGDFDKTKAEELIRQYYGDWEPGYVAPEITPEPEQTAPREATVVYPARTKPIVSVNYRSPAWSATDKIAVATEVLGQIAFGQNSDIYRKLVLQEQKLQFLSAGFGLQRDPSTVSITAMVLNPDDVQMVKDEIEATVQHFRTELPDAKVLADTKNNIKYGFLMGLETAQSIAFSLMTVVINTGSIEAGEDYFDTLEAITPEDIRAAAQQVLVDTGRTTITMVQAEGR